MEIKMTPNIAERVEAIRNWYNLQTFSEARNDVQFLLSLVDKYQKLVESSKEYLQHSYECLEDAHLFTSCQCGLKKLKKEMKESGLLKEKKEGL